MVLVFTNTPIVYHLERIFYKSPSLLHFRVTFSARRAKLWVYGTSVPDLRAGMVWDRTFTGTRVASLLSARRVPGLLRSPPPNTTSRGARPGLFHHMLVAFPALRALARPPGTST